MGNDGAGERYKDGGGLRGERGEKDGNDASRLRQGEAHRIEGGRPWRNTTARKSMTRGKNRTATAIKEIMRMIRADPGIDITMIRLYHHCRS